VKDPEQALRDAIKDFLDSGTEDSKNALEYANGHYNWGDAIVTVPPALFEKHGLKPLGQDTVDVRVDHNETFQAESHDDTEKDKNTFSIYQLMQRDGLHSIRFIGYTELLADGRKPDAKNYSYVCTDYFPDGMTLDDIFHRFNVERPADFSGHSLSASDVVILRRDEIATAYYVDNIMGYVELPEFC
jgi:hypothetical protein